VRDGTELQRDLLPCGEEPDRLNLSVHLEHAARLLRESGPTLAERYGWLEAMINHVPDYIYAKDVEGRFLFANDAVVFNNGLSSMDELIGLTDSDLHGPELASPIAEIEQRVIESGVADLGFEERALKGGPDRWLMMSRVPLKDADGRIVGVVGASRDITARKVSERLMSIQARLLEMIIGAVPAVEFFENFAALLDASSDGVQAALFVPVGDRELELAACPALTWLGHTRVGVVAGMATAARELEDFVRSLRGASDYVRSVDIRASDGSLHAVLVLTMFGRRPGSSFCEFVTTAARLAGIAVDRILAEERIRFLAEHDALTGLLKRDRLDRELKEMLAHAALDGKRVAVAFIDLDNFKLVNDTLGHEAGDELLKEVASSIRDAMGPDGIAARIGGDEFAVVLPDFEGDILDRVEQLRNAIGRLQLVSGHVLQPAASIGVALYPDHGRNPSQLLARADLAMYRSKRNGRDGTTIFTFDMAEEASMKLRRLEELRRAVKNGELILHYQPQKDLRTGAFTGVEALVRWDHPVEGILSPCSFIPIAEESGLILEVGAAVLEMACRQGRNWQDAGLAPVKIGVNMSARQFQDAELTAQVADVLARTGLEPRWLEIEITESLIMKDVDAAVRRMDELTELGVGLALDDFGTGYSSLSMLKRFPLSRLKIDRSFIVEAPNDPDDGAIVSAIISLASTLGLGVVAEGVETEAQAQFLLAAGCHEIQGFLLGRPEPPEVVELLLRCAQGSFPVRGSLVEDRSRRPS
jgi:diguanylate cyclase (GGDEF)-like protein/PAS domain S-box-containing protein